MPSITITREERREEAAILDRTAAFLRKRAMDLADDSALSWRWTFVKIAKMLEEDAQKQRHA